MSVSDKERSLRRRILFNSMPENASEELVQQAIDLLENEFGSDPSIMYSKLVKRLKESIDQKQAPLGNILGRIMMLRNKPPSEIGPDPRDGSQRVARKAASSDRPKKNSAQKKVLTTGSDLVFNTLFDHVAKAIAKSNPENLTSLCERLKSEAAGMKLSRSCGAALISWVNSGGQDFPAMKGPVNELHRVINTTFVWMCEKFGPVDADKMLLRSCKQTEELNEAFDHPPKKFL